MFQIKKLQEQFLSPAVKTTAITRLSEHMNIHFSKEPAVDDKPTCAICFDSSGSGKTTTIMEAAKESNCIRAPISLINNTLFRPMLNSCKNMGQTQNPPLDMTAHIEYNFVKDYFEKRFQTVLIQLFQSIMEQLNTIDTVGATIRVSIPNYISPTKTEFPKDVSSISETYKELIAKVRGYKRLLVIHLDDCQEFFCGLTRNPEYNNDNNIKVAHIMGLALRYFSREVSALEKCKEIMWVFSGTRPNMTLEMKIASNYGEVHDISKYLHDFDANTVRTVFGQYFLLQDISERLKEKIKHLVGPPKHLYWFLYCSQDWNLHSSTDLEKHWDRIEDQAIMMYQEQIASTIKSFCMSPDLNKYARNLCLLYTHSFIHSPEGYLELDSLPSTWLPFIEAGLIRIRRDVAWRLYPPNLFLVKIFKKRIPWFHWDAVAGLVANIRSSTSSTTLKGKVFEFLFALEVQSPSDSALWSKFRDIMKIAPKQNWTPKIQLLGTITSQLDQNGVYIMVDPDHQNSKTDVIFFAESLESKLPVRILCQLTTQAGDSTDKAKLSFNSMFQLADDTVPDYRLYVAPKSTLSFPSIHKQQFSDANCFWLDSSTFGPILQFSLNLCDPSKANESLAELMNFAVSLGDEELARNIRAFIPGTSRKRKREFESMDEFYDELNQIKDWEEQDTVEVQRVLKGQRIKPSQLITLTDAKLEKMGLAQMGLREAVLSVIGVPK